MYKTITILCNHCGIYTWLHAAVQLAESSYTDKGRDQNDKAVPYLLNLVIFYFLFDPHIYDTCNLFTCDFFPVQPSIITWDTYHMDCF